MGDSHHILDTYPNLPELSNNEFDRVMAGKYADRLPKWETRRDDSPFTSVSTTCMTCQGSGEFRYWVTKETPGDFWCDCMDQWRTRLTLWSSGIELKHHGWSWFYVDEEAEGAAREVVEWFSEDKLNQGGGLYLLGKPGTGKTFFAILIMKHAMTKGRFGYYAQSLAKLVDMRADGWKKEDDREWFQRRILNARLLVIDQLGVHVGASNASKEALEDVTLSEVMQHRSASMLPTILLSEQSASSLSKRWPGLLDWVHGMESITLGDRRMRDKMAAREIREKAEGITRPAVLM